MSISEAQKRASKKYLSNFSEIRIRISKQEKESIVEHAKTTGESVNGFVQRAVREAIARDMVQKLK